MREVFVICENRDVFSIFSDNLNHLPIHLSWAGDMDAAEGQLRTEKPDFVFFAVRRVTILHNWIARYKKFKLDIPFLCFTPRISWEKRELLWMAGAADIIQLPMIRNEFHKIIETLMVARTAGRKQESDLSGSLNVFNVIDLIQTFEDGRKNGSVELKHQEKRGEIQFNRGKVVNARLDNKDPLEAILAMATWMSGAFKVNLDNMRHNERILLDNQQVIKECQNHLQKREKLLQSLPDRNVVFYAAPLLDYEEIGPAARKNLLFFKEGKTLMSFIEQNADGSLRMLEDLETWIDKKWLVQRMDYKDQLALLKERENTSPIRKVVNKLFARSSEVERHMRGQNAAKGETEESLQEEVQLKRKPHLFEDLTLLHDFRQRLEKL